MIKVAGAETRLHCCGTKHRDTLRSCFDPGNHNGDASPGETLVARLD